MNKDLEEIFKLMEKLEEYDLDLVISFAIREGKKKIIKMNTEMLVEIESPRQDITQNDSKSKQKKIK